MQVTEIIKELGLTVFSGKNGVTRTISGGYASDLLSDVMGHAREGQVWVTLQTHKNVMAIASMKDLAAVILVKGNQPDDDTLEHSNEEGVPILGTDKSSFEIVGELYKLMEKHEVL